MGAASRCALNRIEGAIAESQSLTPCTDIDLYSNKYPCQVVLDKSICNGIQSLELEIIGWCLNCCALLLICV